LYSGRRLRANSFEFSFSNFPLLNDLSFEEGSAVMAKAFFPMAERATNWRVVCFVCSRMKNILLHFDFLAAIK